MSMSISGSGAMQSPQAWSGASMKMPPAQKMSNLFDKIDTTSSGSITKAQLDQTLQSNKAPSSFQSLGTDKLWSQLDPNATGQVSKQDFTSKMAEIQSQMHTQQSHHHHRGSADNAQSTAQSTNALTALGGNANSTSMISSVVSLKA